jgi:hypothetical protein
VDSDKLDDVDMLKSFHDIQLLAKVVDSYSFWLILFDGDKIGMLV